MTKPHREDFESFVEFVFAVANANLNPGTTDARLEYQSAASGANEKFPSQGGFVVPPHLAMDLWERAYQTGRLLNLCDRQPVTRGNGIRVPAIDERNRANGSRLGGVQLYWADEADEVDASKPKYLSIDLTLNKLFGITYATEELLSDAVALAAVLERQFGLEAATVVEDQIARGSGAGRPLGVLNSGALISIAAESGQAAGTIRSENVVNAWARLWPGSWGSAVWLCNGEAAPQLFALSTGTSGSQSPLVTYADDGPRLLGRPLIAHESCSAVGTVGDLILIDPSQYLIAEREPAMLDSLAVRFLNDERAFRFSWRVAGSPAWSSAVTPLNGTSTVSPFVALESR